MRKSKQYEYRGKFYTIPELVKLSENSEATIRYRIAMGWPIEQAVDKPANKQNRHGG